MESSKFKTKTIKQTVTFKASPHDVYEALMDSRKHSEFTGAKAKISRKVGGKFTAYDGYIDGTNLELVPDQKIVQSWRATEEGWPEDRYSKVAFLLEKISDGTRLTLVHSDIPEKHADSISQGWLDFYWTPMKKMLEK